jgi:hypothetical protein
MEAGRQAGRRVVVLIRCRRGREVLVPSSSIAIATIIALSF